MDLQESADGASNDVFFANFNQNCTVLSVGSKNAFRLYSLEEVEELHVVHGIVADDVRIIERYFRSNLAAVVTVSSPRILKLLDIKKELVIRSYSYPDTILAVKLNKLRLVVCLEESLYIHDIENLNVVRIIRDTPLNPRGLCILSPNEEKNFLAYPGSSSNGEVQIYDAFNDCSMGMIAAHKKRLAAMAFNATGNMIATASDTGTLIRVFDVTEKTKLFEFRRGGVTRGARIYSLCFSQDSNYLSSSSNSETVHIFRLDNKREASAEEPQGLVSYVTSMMVGMLPQGRTAPTSMLDDDRAFATVRLPFSGIRNICALAMIQGSLRVLIASGQRILYIYNVDSVNGGECVLEHTYNLTKSGCSVREENPIRFVCVDALVQHQEAPADTNPKEE